LAGAVVERRQASAPDSGRGRRKPLFPWREPHPLVRWLVQQRLPAFRFSFVPEANLKDFLPSSLPGLTRQSMRRRGFR